MPGTGTCTGVYYFSVHPGFQTAPQKLLLSFEEGAGGLRWSAPTSTLLPH